MDPELLNQLKTVLEVSAAVGGGVLLVGAGMWLKDKLGGQNPPGETSPMERARSDRTRGQNFKS